MSIAMNIISKKQYSRNPHTHTHIVRIQNGLARFISVTLTYRPSCQQKTNEECVWIGK